MIPIGIPGMGKTHFAKTSLKKAIQSLGLSFDNNVHMIQNDEVRKICLNKWEKANPGG